MRSDVFIDSNILVYAHDEDAGPKRAAAKELIGGFWRRRETPSVSVQVLQEVHVNLVRKGVSQDESAARVSRYLQWRLIENTRALFLRSLEIQQRWQLSYWDALIVAAAAASQAAELWTEDMNDGQLIEGVVVRNPLL
ncbi:MAG: PIN domain-containing protein [Opitutales bacterium]|nr:PIN domain-containing protein [Opitutales bacterium]